MCEAAPAKEHSHWDILLRDNGFGAFAFKGIRFRAAAKVIGLDSFA